MICNGCHNENARSIRIRYDETEPQNHNTERQKIETCDACAGLGSVKHSDVYFREPYWDPHLVDVNNPAEKDGVYITSREDKARRMAKLNFGEVGDRNHGARNYDPSLAKRLREQDKNYRDVRD